MCACQAGIPLLGGLQHRRTSIECVLESLFPDSTIIDPAGASHELQNVRILRQNHVSKMSPQMLILLRSFTNEHQLFAEKHIV